MTLQIGEMTVLQAIQDGTGWRPTMDAATATSNANVRAAPSGNGAITATLREGARVVRIGVNENGWAPVAVVGWVSAELLDRSDK